MGNRVPAVDDADASVMWGSNHEAALNRWLPFDAEFPQAES
jgi:hypothetical protein